MRQTFGRRSPPDWVVAITKRLLRKALSRLDQSIVLREISNDAVNRCVQCWYSLRNGVGTIASNIEKLIPQLRAHLDTNLLGQIVADVQTGGAHVDVVIGAVAYLVGDDFVVATMNSRQMLCRIQLVTASSGPPVQVELVTACAGGDVALSSIAASPVCTIHSKCRQSRSKCTHDDNVVSVVWGRSITNDSYITRFTARVARSL